MTALESTVKTPTKPAVGSDKNVEKEPWFRQFWPWFIIALPATVVVASLITVYIAFRYVDPLVNDDYYREGLAINQYLAQDQAAIKLGLNADVRVDWITGEILVVVSGNIRFPDSLQFLLLHPGKQENDRRLTLLHTGRGHYRTDFENLLKHRYYLRLQGSGNTPWRLNGEIDFKKSESTLLRHND